MRLLPRTTKCNPIMVEQNNGKPYSTGYYDTHIKPVKCCTENPDLYGGGTISGWLKGSEYEFRCKKCEKKGGRSQTANGAAEKWNEIFS